MQNKRKTRQPAIFVRLDPAQNNLPLAKRAAMLFWELSNQFQQCPQSCYSAEQNTLRVIFNNSCIDISDLLDQYGPILGSVGRELPLSITGMTGPFEEGEVRCQGKKDDVFFERFSPSGQDITLLQDFALELGCPSPAEGMFFKDMARHCMAQHSFFVFDRRWDDLTLAKEAYEPLDLFYYRYLFPGEAGEGDFNEMIAALSLSKIQHLWEEYLREGVAYEEFARIYEQIQSGSQVGTHAWLVGLWQAMEGAGVRVRLENGHFQVTGSNTLLQKLGYNNPSAAEKLFLKFMFPN